MSSPIPAARVLLRHLLGLPAIAGLLACAAPTAAGAQTSAEAAQRPPVVIPVFVSSRTDLCYDPGDLAAIERLTRLEQDRINGLGGVAGRNVIVRLLDDARDPQRSIANMRAALADPQAVAMIGMSNSNRAKTTFDALGKDIAASGIPFLSDISVNSIYDGVRNVFTTRASQDDERVPVMAEFVRHSGMSRVAFLGLADALFSTSLGDGLARALPKPGLVADRRIKPQGEAFAPADVAAAVAELSTRNPDLLVLSVGTQRAVAVIKELVANGLTPALFLSGRIDALPADVANGYPNAIYQLAWDRLPEAYNDRTRRLISRDVPESWVFEGRKVDAAPGWASGQCKARPKSDIADPLDAANLRAIEIGTQYADMIALVAASVASADPKADIAGLRRHILQQLVTTYAAGRGAFKGRFENWSFLPATRAAQRTPFIVILPAGLGRTQLAPMQFVRVRDGSLKRIETLYLDIDLVRAHSIDETTKSFFAELYLSMHAGANAGIEQIEFSNAFLDPRTNGRQIAVETLHGGGQSDAYPSTMKIYKVTGRFTYEPDLARYPFDIQRYAIDIQPRRSDTPFIVQPPPQHLRDQTVATDGWTPRTQYVGYDEDFVPAMDAFTHTPSIVPFYKASYVWMLQRQTTDYVLRVVVPLAFILAVAYLSIFIPQSHFEAIVTIQVTALLSAVALYLSLPKLDADTATLSDRMFVFNYLMVSLMIGISILRVNRFVASSVWVKRALGGAHIVAVPAVVAAMAYYVWGISVAGR